MIENHGEFNSNQIKETEDNRMNQNLSSNTQTSSVVIKKYSKKKKNTNFYNPLDFPQLRLLQANYKEIKKELLEILELEKNTPKEDKFFQPWIEKDLYEESNPTGWDVAPLIIGGKVIEKNCNKAKFLYHVSKYIPELVSISFSLIKPKTHIVPHKGYEDYSEEILRYHLGLIIPKGDLGLRVNEEIKCWKEGESFIFDDYQTHEAWNYSNEYRYVLICDFASSEIEVINENILNNSKHESLSESMNDQGCIDQINTDNYTASTIENLTSTHVNSTNNINSATPILVFKDKKYNDSITNYI